MRDVLADYIEAREHSALAPISIRTVRDYRGVLVNHVCRARADIGRMPVHRLTDRHIRQWMDDLSADGVGAGTIASSRRVLAAALAWEVREGRLGVNPSTHVRVEASKARRAAMQRVDPVLLPSWAEFAILVETPEREHDRVLMALLGWCGLRWSEAVSLQSRPCGVTDRRSQSTASSSGSRRKRSTLEPESGCIFWRTTTGARSLPRPGSRRRFRCLDRCGDAWWRSPISGYGTSPCPCRPEGCCSGGRSWVRPTPAASA